jgi:hypothetical protein
MTLAAVFLDRRVLEIVFVAPNAHAWSSLPRGVLALFWHLFWVLNLPAE